MLIVVGVVVLTVVAAAVAFGVRSAGLQQVLGRLLPGWPWW